MDCVRRGRVQVSVLLTDYLWQCRTRFDRSRLTNKEDRTNDRANLRHLGFTPAGAEQLFQEPLNANNFIFLKENLLIRGNDKVVDYEKTLRERLDNFVFPYQPGDAVALRAGDKLDGAEGIIYAAGLERAAIPGIIKYFNEQRAAFIGRLEKKEMINAGEVQRDFKVEKANGETIGFSLIFKAQRREDSPVFDLNLHFKSGEGGAAAVIIESAFER